VIWPLSTAISRFLPNLNMVCLFESIKKIIRDDKLVDLLFNGEVPKCLGLAEMMKLRLNLPLKKRVTKSYWSSRPLLDDQLIYAAMDSYATFKLCKLLRKKIEK
jgi:hypothetical protein